MEGRLSLRSRLLLLLTAAVVPIVGLLVWSTLRDAERAVRQTQIQLQLSAELVAAHQNQLADSAAHLLAAIAAVPQVRTLDQQACNSYFEALRDRLPIYANIGLLDASGQVVCHAVSRSGSFNSRDRDFFQRAVAQRRFTVGQAIVGRASARHILPYALPLLHADGTVSGVLFAALDLGVPGALFGRIDVPAGVRLTVADRRGAVLAQGPARAGFDIGRTLHNPQVLEAAQQLLEGAGQGVDASGEQRVFAHAPSRQIGGEGFLAVASMNHAEVIGNAYASLQRQLVALGVALLASLAVAWWLGGRMIVRPANQILRTAAELEKGQLDARIPGSGGRDEFARIAQAVNLMADSLQARQRALEAELGRNRSAYTVLDLVLNSMQEGVIAAEVGGRFLMHNEAAMRLLPLDMPSLPPQDWAAHFGLYLPDRSALFPADALPLTRAVRGETGQVLLWVQNALAPDGRLLQCDFRPMLQADGSIRGGLVVFVDVTEVQRLQHEQAGLVRLLGELNATLEQRIVQRTADLAKQEARFRALAEQAPEIVWNTDARGRTTYINRAWAELVGGEPHEWLGTRWMERIHPDDLPPMRANWDRARVALTPYTGTRRVRARDGSWHTTFFRAAPVLGQDGQVEFWVGIDTDITELKAIEAALRTSNQELEEFSYSISHDLRSPLAAIGGFSKALEERLSGHPDDKVRHYLSRIQAGADRMDELIAALLSLAQLVRRPLEWGSVDLSQMAGELLEGLHEQDPARAVQWQVASGLLTYGDARLLRTVLQNLLGNAWKFSAHNPAARIDVGRLDGVAEPTFYVRDNGVGFDMQHAGKLFGPFQRLHTQSEFPGTGVGLATVQRAVARHQGRVWVESVPGQGTTFYFSLPETAPPAILRPEA